MSNIPEARRRLRAVARQLRRAKDKKLAAEVHDALQLLYRRRAARRMHVKSQAVTPYIKSKVIELAESTDLHSAEIAAEVGINPGRVSEILQGDR